MPKLVIIAHPTYVPPPNEHNEGNTIVVRDVQMLRSELWRAHSMNLIVDELWLGFDVVDWLRENADAGAKVAIDKIVIHTADPVLFGHIRKGLSAGKRPLYRFYGVMPAVDPVERVPSHGQFGGAPYDADSEPVLH